MELWNDFEGKTVDGRFQLVHLIGPKGRSAYFTAKDETGAPAVIRLIESLNDEEEILGRWRRVTGWKQEHLVEVLACGQTVLDGTHLVYAVMEPTDIELMDVLRDRALSPDETRQIALSVADGLEALHAKGLVHEHVEAENVLARGETVKLRSDVVRDAPEGAEGAALRAKDVRDLSLLLHQCLTRSRKIGEVRLPVPFDEAIRKGESGSWGLGAMIAALRPLGSVPKPVVPAGAGTPAAAPPATAARPAAGAGVTEPMRAPGVSRTTTAAAVAAGASSVAPTAPRVQGSDAPGSSAPTSVGSRLTTEAATPGEGIAAHVRSPRVPDRIVMEPGTEPKRTGLLIGVCLGVLVLVLLGVHFFRASRTGQTRSVVQDTPSAMAVPQQSSGNRPPARDTAPEGAEKPMAAAEATREEGSRGTAVATGASGAGDAGQWRVVAFTYNREGQAAEKVKTIAARHPGLHPEVFSASGHAPYLVTLGGWMSANQAATLRSKARSEGMPRDTYTRNYGHRGR